jgi:NTP pyrophosphatase (non-canonical NTP hydrolase)
VRLNTLEMLIERWGHEKGILPYAVPTAQLEKTEEEVAELRQAIEDRDVEEIADAIGDIFVTLVMQTRAWGLDMETCVEQAYQTISKRTGVMVDGKFVKDDDNGC